MVQAGLNVRLHLVKLKKITLRLIGITFIPHQIPLKLILTFVTTFWPGLFG